MVKGTSTVVFKQTLLASFIGLCMSQTAFALQEISDEGLSQTTGEGIAFLPENFSMVMQKAENDAAKWDHTDRSLDTGYIRYIPVGPLSNMAPTTAGKADLYLYGLAISKGDNDLNNRLGGVIGSWGTAENPWLFKVQTDSNIPNFGSVSTPSNNCNTTPDACKVTYLALEAPRYHITKPTTVASGADAYDLKLAFWADAFVRDPRQPEKTLDTGASAADVAASTQFNLNGADRANRLRLQAVWDGFSINGSQIQMFQTLGGAVGNASGGYIKDTSYNNTLGMAGVLRFNSGDTRNLKATIVDSTVENTGTISNWQQIHQGTDPMFGSVGGGCNNGGATNTSFNTSAGCQFVIESQSRTDSKTRTRSWELPTSGVLRFSTRETGMVQNKLDSPAINGVTAPNFDETEGLYLYGANINLVLGTLYQPLMVNKDVNSNNLVLEIAAIPNKPDLYKRIYTAYDGFLGGANKADYQGSTCSVYACGKNSTATYQGTNATHSSISIGSTEYNATTGLMTAYKGEGAVGVSFGALQNKTLSASTTFTGTQVRYQQRQVVNDSWRSAYWCSSTFIVCTGYSSGNANLYQWEYWTGNGFVKGGTAVNKPNDATCSGTGCNQSSSITGSYDGYTYPTCPTKANCGDFYGTTSNRNWSTSGAVWRTGTNAALDSLMGKTTGSSGSSGYVISGANMAPIPVVANPEPLHNLGSAVIDGMLIQHMKITTKGL